LRSLEDYVKWSINSDKETFQWQFVTDLENKTIVDYIGKFESLQEDLSHIGGHLNIDLGLNHHNKTMRSEKKQISEYFNKNLIDFVKINYEKDFEFFGYDIDKTP
jgi:chondroitin 4-sulfotransferase 11